MTLCRNLKIKLLVDNSSESCTANVALTINFTMDSGIWQILNCVVYHHELHMTLQRDLQMKLQEQLVGCILFKILERYARNFSLFTWRRHHCRCEIQAYVWSLRLLSRDPHGPQNSLSAKQLIIQRHCKLILGMCNGNLSWSVINGQVMRTQWQSVSNREVSIPVPLLCQT